MKRPGSLGRPTNTPGFWGYVAAVLSSLAFFAVEAAFVGVFQDHDNIADCGAVVIVVLIFGLLPALVIGGVGAFLTHLIVRRVSQQWCHIAVAAGVGLAIGTLIGWGRVPIGLSLALPAGFGRWTVCPLVRRRRRRASREADLHRAVQLGVG